MKKYLVWDLPTRLFHWLLVALIVAQWLTAELLADSLDMHMLLGYVTLGLLLFRLLWGLVGSKYARFSDFIYTPKAIVSYLNNPNSQQSIGHNPLGGLMVLLLLTLVLLQAVSGLFISDEVLANGPYNSALSSDWIARMEWLHHNVFNWLLYAIAVHIAAIVWYKVVKKQNLLIAMFSGKKAIHKAQSIPSSRLLLALVLVLLVSAFIYWLVVIAPPPAVQEFYY